MSDNLRDSTSKVQQVLDQMDSSFQVVELPGGTRTSIEAANSIGCEVSQIAKSLIFRGRNTGQAVLIIASGSNRVNEKIIAEHIGEPIAKADAAFVREQTGFVIGGVPPVGHIQPLLTLIDEDLLSFAEIWAAAGTPYAVFRLTPDLLVAITKGTVIQLKK